MRFKFILALPVLSLLLFGCSAESADPSLESFAQCLSDQGVQLYVSATCSHCHAQREAFGSAEAQLNLTDCYTDHAACVEQAISSVPTWVFSDGTRLTGVQTFATLAAQSGCPLPADVTLEN